MGSRFRLGGREARQQTQLLREALIEAGWTETEGVDYDLFWDPAPATRAKVAAVRNGQRYSHFRGSGNLTDADRLFDHLVIAQLQRGPALYDFFPQTFALPDERDELLAAAADSPTTRWIAKPRRPSPERGATRIADVRDAAQSEDGLVQEYLDRPHLLDGDEYTLRLYVLIESLEPLTVYLYRDGFAGGLTCSAYRARLRDEGQDEEALWQRLRSLVALTVIATRGAMIAQSRRERVPYAPGFELLGFDVRVDRALKPWLLGCTLSPSLSVEAAAGTPAARAEHATKRGVVRETLRLLGVALPRTQSDEPVAIGWERLLPDAAQLAAFAAPRWADLVAVGAAPPRLEVIPDGVTWAPLGEGLGLYDRAAGRIVALGAARAESWRRMVSGAPPRDSAEWDTIVGWLEEGLVRRRDTPWLEAPSDEGAVAQATIAPATLLDPQREEIGVPLDGEAAPEPRLDPAVAVQRLSLRATPNVSPAAATELLTWLATRRYVEITPPAARNEQRDRIAACLAYVCDRLEERGLWYSLAYGTLLGALREGDVIAWDYDFDLLVRPDDLEQILALGPRVARDGYRFEPTRKPPSFLAMNPAGVTSFSTAAVGIYHRERKLGDLYAFSAFADGVMRRWDFEHDIYWCPHSSFPAYFVEALTEVTLRGRRYPAVQQPEKWIAGVYGEDWRTPYRAVAQGGERRPGATVHGDRYEPKLAAEIEWALARGWDRSRYATAPPWPPRRLGGGGPKGPTARTRDNSRSLWWRDLDELVRYF